MTIALRFQHATTGIPTDGQGEVLYLAGEEVTTVVRAFKGNPDGGAARAWLDVIAPGYRFKSATPQDSTKAPEQSAVPADALVWS